MEIINYVLIGLVAFVFIGSGFVNIVGGERAKQIEAGYGGRKNQIWLSALKILIGILWLIPQTSLLGALLGIAYFGGAIAVHITTKTPVAFVLVIETIIWISSAIRFPELTQRLFGN